MTTHAIIPAPLRSRPSAITAAAIRLFRAPLLAAAIAAPLCAYTVPNTADLLFGVNTDSLPASGNTGAWAAVAPAGGTFSTIGTPTVDNVGSPAVRWEKNVAFGNGYFNAWAWTTPVDVNGVSAVAVVKPLRAANLRNWTPVIDVLFGEFRLGVRNDDGRVILERKLKGQVYSSTGNAIPNGQTTVLSAVVQPDGSYEVWANGISIMTGGTIAEGCTSLANGTRRLVCLGTSQDDQSATLNGNIGDVYMWKVALGATERTTLEGELMTKFRAGASYPAQTITATAGAGGTISPSGAVTVAYDADQTFTISKNFGYGADVVVDGVSQGDLASYTFHDVAAAHTITANFTALPTRTISGHVTAASGGGATVSVKLTSASLPAQQATTDASGNYSLTVPEGVYQVCASQTGYLISADVVTAPGGDQVIDFTLAAKRNIPKMESLLFAADSNDLGAVGTAGAWPLLYHTYPAALTQLTAINSPTVTKVRGIKYNLNNRVAPEDGYRLNTAMAGASIPTSGATVVAVVKPLRNTTGDGWNSVVDIFRDNLILGVKNNTGQIQVRRNGTDYWSTNNAAGTLADGQLAILSLVVQPDGQFKVWCSKWNSTTNQFDAASVILSSTATSAFTAFVPAQSGPEDWRKWINIGRNNGDGWSTFNGYIGDTFVYKTALTDTERATLEADINTKTTDITTYNITATAGPGGSISPAGVTSVGESDSQSYTITPAFGFNIADVLVDGVSNPGAVGSGSYTFSNVTATHTIDASFAAKPTYAVSGQVTDGTNPIAGAKVYVSSTANASVSPLYTLTTDGGGNYSVPLFDGTWYLCASSSGYTTSADQTATVAGAAYPNVNFALAASSRNIPQMDQLAFALYGTALTANGATTNPWPLEHPLGATAAVMGTPTLTTVDGVQWESNRYASADGYRVGYYTAAIPVNGLTATAVVQPQGDGSNGGDWTSIIDVMYNRLVLGIRGTTGELVIIRNGNRRNTGVIIPNGQKTVLTAVVQPDGKYKVFVNGIELVNETGTSAMTGLDPYWNGGGLGFWSYINVGRNNPDGWTTYKGNIGAALLWKTALSQTERVAFESQLGATFGITLPVYHTITASAGAGGTISPAGAIPVLGGTDQAFTITPEIGYRINQVLVDGVNDEEAVTTGLYTFGAVETTHTIAASFVAVPQHTISGTVTDRTTGLPVSGATVNFSTTPNAFVNPYATATTDDSGNYTKTLYDGTIYVSATKSGYYNSADQTVILAANTEDVDFSLVSSTRNIPAQSSLWFSAVTESFPLSGLTGPWPGYLPAGLPDFAPLSSPTAEIINGVKWELNLNADADAYRVFGPDSTATPVQGATIVVAVKPVRYGAPNNWQSVVDIYRDNLVLAMQNGTGQVTVIRNNQWNTSTTAIPDGQVTILSLVVQPDGTYRVFANGVEVLANTTPSPFEAFIPNQNGPEDWRSYVNLGRNNGDGWATFNGNIGDVFVYKTALSQADRLLLESDLAAKFGVTPPVYHTITATAGPNGSISPSGAYKVAAGQNQTFTITPDAGFVVADLVIDGASYGADTTYMFPAVAEPHTIHATFTAAPDGYTEWISLFFDPESPQAARDADPDGDGQNNLTEYALDGEPASGQATGKVRSRIELVGGENALLITLPVLDGADFDGTTSQSATIGGVTYTIDGSNNLGQFNQAVSEVTPARSEGMQEPYFGWSYRTFRLDGAIGGPGSRGPAGFLRVRIADATPPE